MLTPDSVHFTYYRFILWLDRVTLGWKIRDVFAAYWYARGNLIDKEDLEHRLSCILNITTGVLSKAYYPLATMEAAISERQQQDYDVAYADALDDGSYGALVRALSKAERDVWMKATPKKPFVESDVLARAQEFAHDACK